MIFSFFSFDGDVFPLAYRLQEKGHEVLVCQIEDPKLLGTQTWITDKETPEAKRRRMSLFDGMLKKLSFSDMMVQMSKIVHKDYCFVMIGHNSLCKISERLLKMGFTTGLMPTTEDYEREKDRKKAKDFVRKHYSGIKVAESKEFSSVDEAVKFISESDKFWVVKSDGNFGETIVPDRDDLELAKQQVLGELKEYKSAYNKGKLILEEKIMNAIEFSPQIVFFNGEPVYSHVEIETRMFGSGDIGDQTGGNQNLIVRTEPDAKINEIAFPKVVHDLAKKHRGMFIFDAGILSDGEDLYFTEFAGNRHGWGGVFSEMSASQANDGDIERYFQSVVYGENPFRYMYGGCIALYTIASDHKFPGLPQGDLPIFTKNGTEKEIFFSQVKMKTQEKEKRLVNIGYREYNGGPLAYVTGRGNTVQEVVDGIYKTVLGISLKGVYYRPSFDYLSTAYTSSIPNRLKFLEDKNLL